MICSDIVPSVFVLVSLAERVNSSFTHLVLCIVIVAFSKGYIQVFKSDLMVLSNRIFMIVLFLLAINHSCLPLTEWCRDEFKNMEVN